MSTQRIYVSEGDATALCIGVEIDPCGAGEACVSITIEAASSFSANEQLYVDRCSLVAFVAGLDSILNQGVGIATLSCYEYRGVIVIEQCRGEDPTLSFEIMLSGMRREPRERGSIGLVGTSIHVDMPFVSRIRNVMRDGLAAL